MSNITNCMTRLRLSIIDKNKVNIEKLTSNEKILGVNYSGDELQIIIGPGLVKRVKDELEAIISKEFTSSKEGENTDNLLKDSDLKLSKKENIGSISNQNFKKVQTFLLKFSKIFSPLIIGFIGVGILATIAGIIKSANGGNLSNNPSSESWYNILIMLLNIWNSIFIVIVGWRTSSVFGGSGVVGAILASMYIPALSSVVTSVFIQTNPGEINWLGLNLVDPINNWLLIGFEPTINNSSGLIELSSPEGSIFGVLIISGLSVPIEKYIRKKVPNNINIIISSTVTFFILLFANYLLVFPISYFLFEGISWFFNIVYQNPFGAAILAGVFLIAVIYGVHQCFIPIYFALLQYTGINGLFPILAMAGASQIGAALALYMRAEKGGILKDKIRSNIIPSFLGIGEPLLYSAIVPRTKVLIATCIGASIGGFVIGSINTWGGIDMGLNTAFGPSGVLSILLMTTKEGNIGISMGIYLASFLSASVAGFLATATFGTKNVDLK